MIQKLRFQGNRLFLIALLLWPIPVWAMRIKDIASIKGVRENILIGYGIVVGLKGTGDSSIDITVQSLNRLFSKLGLDIQNSTNIKTKNAAAVIVTTKLPSFARSGKMIDCVVSSIGDSNNIEGGNLLITPLNAGDQNVYAIAQGTVGIGGRISNCATIEKEIQQHFAEKASLRLHLNQPDFTTAARMVTVINNELGGKFATAQDSATIDLIVPSQYEGNTVALMALIENFSVSVDLRARVVLNEKTGTIVIGEKVQIMPIAISHGDLSIEVKGASKGAKPHHMIELKETSNVSALVHALNALGVTPKDLIAIFQTLKESGALHAELQIL